MRLAVRRLASQSECMEEQMNVLIQAIITQLQHTLEDILDLPCAVREVYIPFRMATDG